MKYPTTLHGAIDYFSDPGRTFAYAVQCRWPGERVSCPQCGSGRHAFLRARRIWECAGCKRQFSVKAGTILEDSAIGLGKWMVAVWMVSNCEDGVSSYEIARTVGVTQKTAWLMLRRIGEAMKGAEAMKLGRKDGGEAGGEFAAGDGGGE